jgi:hypothetical protein
LRASYEAKARAGSAELRRIEVPGVFRCRRTVSGPDYTASCAGDLVLDCVKR